MIGSATVLGCKHCKGVNVHVFQNLKKQELSCLLYFMNDFVQT